MFHNWKNVGIIDINNLAQIIIIQQHTCCYRHTQSRNLTFELFLYDIIEPSKMYLICLIIRTSLKLLGLVRNYYDF